MSIEFPFHEGAKEEEEVRTQNLAYLAGTIEAGATTSISKSKNTSRPVITVSEIREGVTLSLQEAFGERTRDKGNSSVWTISGRKAAELLVELLPYIVTRKEYADAAYNWLESASEERRTIAEELKGFDRFSLDTKVEDYSKLVDNPHFVAGIMDTRGNIYSLEKGKRQKRLNVEVGSLNKPLLDALCSHYGGEVTVKVEKGTPGSIDGVDFVTKRTSYQWLIDDSDARNFVRSVESSLVIKPQEGWDYSHTDVEQAEIASRTQDIIEFMRLELELCEQGELLRPKNRKELASAFRVSESTIKRTFKDVPKDIRKQREKLLREGSKRVLSETQIKTLVQDIKEEVQRHKENPDFILRFNANFGVSKDIILRHVVPHLPNDIRKYRARVLRGLRKKI